MSKRIYDGTLSAELYQLSGQEFAYEQIKTFSKDFLQIIKDGLLKEGHVHIHQFGTFKVRQYKQRKGRNPQTGETIIIKAHKRVIFRPAKALLERLNPHAGQLTSQTYKNAAMSITPIATTVIKEPFSDISANTTEEKTTDCEARQKRYELKWLVAGSLTTLILASIAAWQLFYSATPQTPDIVSHKMPAIQPAKTKNKPSEERQILTSNPQIDTISFEELEDPELTNLEDSFDITPPQSFVDDDLGEQELDWLYKDNYQPLTHDQYDTAEIDIAEKAYQDNDSLLSESNLAAEKTATPLSQVKPFFPKQIYKIKFGDNLWNLAKKNYQQAILWPHIYHNNPVQIHNPDKLKTGKEITLPELTGSPEHLTKKDKRNIAEGYWRLYQYYKKTRNEFAVFALLGVKQFDQQVIEENKKAINAQDMKDFLAMAEA